MNHKGSGFTGFTNLGNTCYINSTLFILSHIDIINSYIINKNIDNSLLNEWKEIYKLFWDKNCIISPNKFINANRNLFKIKNKDEFLDNEQCDSIEYFLYFIETLQQELNNDPFFNKIFDIECNIKYLDEKKQEIYFEKKQKHWILALNIPNKNTCSIEECIDYTFKDEFLSGDNAWYDEKEKIKKNVYIKSTINHTPNILILQIKRWNENGNKLRKVIMVGEHLDILTEQDKKTSYELFGMINHHGSTNQGGHYYSTIKKNKKWYTFNDTTIQEINFSNLINETIYCLFYKKLK